MLQAHRVHEPAHMPAVVFQEIDGFGHVGVGLPPAFARFEYLQRGQLEPLPAQHARAGGEHGHAVPRWHVGPRPAHVLGLGGGHKADHLVRTRGIAGGERRANAVGRGGESQVDPARAPAETLLAGRDRGGHFLTGLRA